MIVNTDEYIDNLRDHLNSINDEYGNSLTIMAVNFIASVYIIVKFVSKIVNPALRALVCKRGTKGKVVHHIL
nr:TPA_asm: P6 [Pogostemom alphacytorhabdovirus 3_Pog]